MNCCVAPRDAQKRRQGIRGESVEHGQARAVDDAYAGHGHSGLRERARDDGRTGGARSILGLRRAELLEEELRGQVVAFPIHELHDRREGR